MINSDADPNLFQQGSMTPMLACAASWGDLGVIQVLVRAGADVNASNEVINAVQVVFIVNMTWVRLLVYPDGRNSVTIRLRRRARGHSAASANRVLHRHKLSKYGASVSVMMWAFVIRVVPRCGKLVQSGNSALHLATIGEHEEALTFLLADPYLDTSLTNHVRVDLECDIRVRSLTAK